MERTRGEPKIDNHPTTQDTPWPLHLLRPHLCLHHELQLPFHQDQAILRLSQLLLTNPILPHVLVPLFQKPDCLPYMGRKCPRKLGHWIVFPQLC